MRHRLSGRQLGRKSSHRTAMWNNMVTALLTHGRIETTVAKAKDLRGHAEATITWSVDVVDLIAKGDKASAAEKAKILHARRQARLIVKTRDAMEKLFTEVGPHFAGKRAGGYTRIIQTRVRKGDAAPMAFIELVGLNGQPSA
ncbi:MAG TPA: 50S ribosomal protein L17 [Kofleriaceae bacterium]|jgi:large subunit ribosomal protein L17